MICGNCGQNSATLTFANDKNLSGVGGREERYGSGWKRSAVGLARRHRSLGVDLTKQLVKRASKYYYTSTFEIGRPYVVVECRLVRS